MSIRYNNAGIKDIYYQDSEGSHKIEKIYKGRELVYQARAVLTKYEIGSPVASDVIATLYEDGVLEFSGTGDIEKYYSIYNEETGEETEKFAPWYDDTYFYGINHIVFAKNNTIQPTSTSYLFYELTNVTSVDVSNLDTSLVTDMSYMFNYCTSLTEITGLKNLNTSNVINMEGAFESCRSLNSLDLSGWNTSKVTSMAYMFEGCTDLVSLDLSGWNTSKVTNMVFMFGGSISLTEIKGLESLNTSNVIEMDNMFYNCQSLSGSITIMNSNISYYEAVFEGCSTATGSKFIVNYTNTYTKAMAQEIVNTKSSNSNVVLYIPPANLINGEDFNTAIEFFGNSDSIQFLNEPPTDPTPGDILLVSEATSPVKAYMALLPTGEIIVYPEEAGSPLVANKSCYRMFYKISVTSINFNNFDTSNVTNMEAMFRGCDRLMLLDLSKFNTSKVTNMKSMFNGCSMLESIYVKDLWNISNVINDEYMFYKCTSIIGKSGTSYNSNKVGKEMANIETGYLTDEKTLLVKTASENTYKIMISNNKKNINIKTQSGVTSYNGQIQVRLYDTLEIGKSYKISIETLNGASFYSSMSGNSAGAGDGTWNTNGNISELIFTATSATSELVLFSSGVYMTLPNTPAVSAANIRFYEIS